MLEWIMAIAELCNRSIAAGKTIATMTDALLSHREKELLISAQLDGMFHAMQSDINGRFVWTSTREFTDQDPAVTAHYLDAFIRLCNRGLVIHQTEEVFRLTGQGFDIARKLAKSR